MTEEVLVLDTTTRHKEMLLNDLSRVKIELTKAQKIENHELIINMFWLVSRLFGFDYQSGTVKNKAFYHQDYASFLKEKVKELAKENLGMSAYEIKENGYKNIITKRKYLYKQLKSEKFSDQIIAQIFNTTEYQIKKLKNDL